MTEKIQVRIHDRNPNHHLWLNNGTWFVHYTLHRSDYTKVRVRTSLNTGSIIQARRLREKCLNGKLRRMNAEAAP